jgi:hypothetical protein
MSIPALKSSNAGMLILITQANLSRKNFPGDEKKNAEATVFRAWPAIFDLRGEPG